MSLNVSMSKLLLLVILVVLNTGAHAEDWPHWRGPRHDGTSRETGLPTTWSQGENVRWRLKLPGPAPSTPIVWQDRIFLTSADGDDLVLLAVSRDGQILWKRAVSSGNQNIRQGESNMAAPTPSTDGEHIWVFFGTGDLACYDFNGEEIWKFNVQERYKSFRIYWGMSTTPLLDGNLLYLLLLHTNQQLVLALDKNTGGEVWQHQRKSDAYSESLHSYASPVIYRFDGQEFLLTHGADYIVAHDLRDGSEIWRCGGLQSGIYNPLLRFVATPVVTAGLIVVPSAKNGPILGLNPKGARGDITQSSNHVIWKRDNHTPDVPSPVIYDGLVYLCRENGQLLCLDTKSGKEVYYERAHNKRHRGSPVYADGKLYLVGMDGTVTVLKAGRHFEILAKNQMQEQTAASPAISDGTIYLRTYEALYAISGK
ncbi:MAG: PQQ-binding-like beta-propeller repeat protein [Aliifodinibius sp.]|nr:PQQ-binding-like beta-propeller repeat protein [Fodinibius sp.]NIV14842.1 PQQ-binding-like beta-propeller repeat protein [Fodinibius sp.]NIY28721.1 PQQ-binding-like beta-propeller repeat protein [Fodinibius sp.]